MNFGIELTEINATVIDVNPRKEGKEKETLAADIKVEVGLTQDVLACFSPTLRGFLFDVSGPTDLAGGAMVRYEAIKYPIQWDAEQRAEVWFRVNIGNPIQFPAARVHKFQITPHNGGTVTLGFTVSVYPDAGQVGRASELIGQQTIITVMPAELLEMKAAA